MSENFASANRKKKETEISNLFSRRGQYFWVWNFVNNKSKNHRQTEKFYFSENIKFYSASVRLILQTAYSVKNDFTVS